MLTYLLPEDQAWVCDDVSRKVSNGIVFELTSLKFMAVLLKKETQVNLEDQIIIL